MRIVLLGRLSDLADMLPPDLPDRLDWQAVTTTWPPALAEAVTADTVRVAVNGALLSDRTALDARTGDEVAFLPPVSGG